VQDERRDYRRRAETMRQVVERLVRDKDGVDPGGVAADGLADTAAARRILKQLALRGLAHEAAGKWMPSQVLCKASPLHRCD
jgi:hypothetical protein